MALNREVPDPFCGRDNSGYLRKLRKRSRIRVTLSEGDVLVLTTAPYDSQGVRQEVTDLVNVFLLQSLQHAPDVKWTVADQSGRLFDGRTTPVQCSPYLTLALPLPVSIVRTVRGFKTVFTATVAAGYHVHHLGFVKKNLPGVYQQLSFN